MKQSLIQDQSPGLPPQGGMKTSGMYNGLSLLKSQTAV